MLNCWHDFNVEISTNIQRWKICCILNVVSTLKHWRSFNVENMLHLQRCFNVEKTSMLQRWNLNVESTLNYSCSTLQPIFNLFSTLKQRCVPAGLILNITHIFVNTNNLGSNSPINNLNPLNSNKDVKFKQNIANHLISKIITKKYSNSIYITLCDERNLRVRLQSPTQFSFVTLTKHPCKLLRNSPF